MPAPVVSIVIPVYNKLAFTRQCLERLGRDRSGPLFEVIVVDNASTDDTETFFNAAPDYGYSLIYIRNSSNLGFSKANNVGVAASSGTYLLFLNNDTIVTPGWLSAMVRAADSDPRVGVVGIKQLFPYTNKIHHTGIIFTSDRRPQHIYPYADGSLSHVNQEREYQAVTGSCLLIDRDLFEACGRFDEEYRNGFEDIELCLSVRRKNRTVVCCTSGFIYHYGQISDTRTDDDDTNAARLSARWRETIVPDEHTFFSKDRRSIENIQPAASQRPTTDPALIFFADDLSTGSALSWVTDELIRAIERQGRQVAVAACVLGPSVPKARREFLERRMRPRSFAGGVQIRWSHYWPQHLNLDLNGWLNLELFVINYQFGEAGSQPWDYWLQSLTQNHYRKLPLSSFCQNVLGQIGVPASECHVVRPGYSPEIRQVAAPRRQDQALRFLTVTNSHDLERYGTRLLLEAYWATFRKQDDVVLVLKDYGAASGDVTLRQLIRERGRDQAAIQYVTEFTSKEKLIELYKSCDAFVSAHRGEGYGMKILDAVACGLPVITPLFGGPTDFCNDTNSLPVRYALEPVGDCFDTRALPITNGPLWAEPDPTDLAARLREVADDPAAARQLGERAAADVLGRLTWDDAAQQLLAFVDREAEGLGGRRLRSAPPAVVTEKSPYWLGCRLSVIVPTYNRKDALRQCLAALERQTILPNEFEVLVVDDGSSDGTAEMVRSLRMPFRLQYLQQANAGPGAARNHGLHHATGEFVMFIGDDIFADERLLESHLLAHVGRSEPGAAVLGHIDWDPALERTAVMDYVCGPSTLQFAYTYIPTLPELDYRFFYTSNISLRRQFLLEAAADGVAFDGCFTKAAFEDSELALRLTPRGLRIKYCADARACHHHWMDLEGFVRRERAVGQMAVVFYRKHPQVDEMLQVRWIGDWTGAVEELMAKPELDAKLTALDQQTDTFLQSLARTLDEFGQMQRSLGASLLGGVAGRPASAGLLESVYSVIFDVARTQGKVEEWYRGVADARRVETAVRLLGCVRRMEFLSASPEEVRRLKGTINWLETDVVRGLETRVVDLERHLGGRRPPVHNGVRVQPWLPEQLAGRLSSLEHALGTGRVPAGPGLRRRMVNAMRRADRRIQHELGRPGHEQWLARYFMVRRKLRQLLPPRT